MNLIYFKEKDLPLKELETIGLASDGQLLLNVNDLKALLSGRRTGIMQLQNLEAQNIKIKSLDAKISLRRKPDGKVDLLIHPIYRKPATPDFLDESEARQLESGEIENLLRVTTDSKGNKKELLVEYDKDTREFIISDTEKIMAPDMVNGEFLTAAQKERYKKGKEIEMADHTKLNYSGVDIHGIRSDKLHLVASILIDGGLSYMVYHGLNALFNKERDDEKAGNLCDGYYSALQDVEDQRPNFEENLRKARPVVSR